MTLVIVKAEENGFDGLTGSEVLKETRGTRDKIATKRPVAAERK